MSTLRAKRGLASQQQLRTDIFRGHVLSGQRPGDLAFFHDAAALGDRHDRIEICSTKTIVVPSSLRNDFSASQMCCTIDGCTPSGRLVEDHQGRIADQRAPDRQLLLLAPRHRARDLSPALLQPRKIFVDEFRQLLSFGPPINSPTCRFSSTLICGNTSRPRDVPEAGASPGIGLQP
jgi:hypothetical protein